MAQDAPPFGALNRTRALETWREAAQLVSARWQAFVEAQPDGRTWAFAAYVAALDGEEAAAAELATCSTRLAA